jgi:hypothetical protein
MACVFLANLLQAKDAALSIALRELNSGIYASSEQEEKQESRNSVNGIVEFLKTGNNKNNRLPTAARHALRRAKRRNLQFCDPGHLHPRQGVRRCIERNGDGHEGYFGASAGPDARSWRCGGSSYGGSFADSGTGR